MYCKECGKLIDDDSKFCSYCGTKQSLIHLSNSNNETKVKSESIPQKIDISLSFGKPTDREPKELKQVIQTEKYDRSYHSENEATIVGSIAVIVNLIILLTVRFSDPYNQQTFTAVAAIINIFWKIIVTVWVINIAKRQNRNHIGWGFFAFFLTNLALIIIGTLKKLYKPELEQRKEESQEFGLVDEIPINGFEPSTYVEKIIKKQSFWHGNQDEFIIEFPNSKSGKVFTLGRDCYYFIYNNERIYYDSKEAAIIGLDYFLKTSKIYETNRLTGNFAYYPL